MKNFDRPALMQYKQVVTYSAVESWTVQEGLFSLLIITDLMEWEVGHVL